jgi:polyketide synthase 12
VHSRPDGGVDPWTRHATGVLAPTGTDTGTPLAEWPPVGAEPVDVSALYADLADRGLSYGPVFRGVRAAWRRGAGPGSEVFAEVELESEDPAGFLLHPALLDAALHPIGLGGVVRTGGLPFTWQGLRVHAVGARALRVRLAALGGDAVAVDLADSTGAPVAGVKALRLRAVTADQVATASAVGDPVLRLDWLPVSTAEAPIQEHDEVGVEAVLLRLDEARGPGSPGDVRRAVYQVLAEVQRWIAEDRAERLVVVTRSMDLAGAAVGGLLRAAQAEHPGRFGHVETDEHVASRLAVPPAAALVDESRVAVRAGELFVPRLARNPVDDAGNFPFGPDDTVLITGAGGTLGGLVARHPVPPS